MQAPANYCPTHRDGRRKGSARGGTTAAWAKARKAALQRDGYRCRICGMTDEEHRQRHARGHGLAVHHVQAGYGVQAEEYRLDDLLTTCAWCHRETLHRRGAPAAALEAIDRQADRERQDVLRIRRELGLP